MRRTHSPPLAGGKIPLCLALVAVLAIVSCDRAPLVAPRTASVDVMPTTPRAALGSYPIPVPPTNAPPTNGAVEPQGTSIHIPANTAVRITVSGKVIVTSNPELAVYYPEYQYTDLGSFGPNGTGTNDELMVRVWFQPDTGSLSSVDGITFDSYEAGISGPETITSVVYSQQQSGTLWVRRNGIFGLASGDGRPTVPLYALSGTQTVTADLVPTSLAVTCSPSPVARGGSTSCTANGSGSLRSFRWKFTPLDSAVGDSISRPWTTDSLRWAGRLVTNGTVKVSARISEQYGAGSITDSVRVAVTPRVGWTWRDSVDTARATPGQTGTDCYPAPHWTNGTLGWVLGPDCGNLNVYLKPNPFGARNSSGIYLTRLGDGGPNDGLTFLDSMKTRLRLTAQIQRDLRTDGTTYEVKSTDSVAAGCASAKLLPKGGKSAYLNFRTVNLLCMQNPDFTASVNFTWNHEGCHMRRAVIRSLQLPDARAEAESLVRADTSKIVAFLFSQSSYLRAINDSIFDYSKTIDTMTVPPTSWVHWGKWASDTGTWMRGTRTVHGVLC